MRTSLIVAGDIVYCNKRGHFFYARVLDVDASGTLRVEPIERNVSYRHVDAAQIAEHWARSTKTRRAAVRAHKTTQSTLELPLTF
jgi:hypothetical protein